MTLGCLLTKYHSYFSALMYTVQCSIILSLSPSHTISSHVLLTNITVISQSGDWLVFTSRLYNVHVLLSTLGLLSMLEDNEESSISLLPW